MYSLRFGGVLLSPRFIRPMAVSKNLSFIANAQKRALDDEVEVELHGLGFVLRVGDVLLREPYSIWDVEIANSQRVFRAFAKSDRFPPLTVVAMMALGAASLSLMSGEDYDADAEGLLAKRSEARYQLDTALEAADAAGPEQLWHYTLMETAIVSLESTLQMQSNVEIQASTVQVQDPLMLWSDMMSIPDDDADDEP